jgi:hypothetical protein
VEGQAAATAAIHADSDQRLRDLRVELAPLLRRVADGEVQVDDPDVARAARELVLGLRAELVENYSGRWLLGSASRVQSADGLASPVAVLDADQLLVRLLPEDRAALVSLVGWFQGYSSWQQLSVLLAPLGDSAQVHVIAIGSGAVGAANDPALVAAAGRLRSAPALDTPEALVVESLLGLAPG